MKWRRIRNHKGEFDRARSEWYMIFHDFRYKRWMEGSIGD